MKRVVHLSLMIIGIITLVALVGCGGSTVQVNVLLTTAITDEIRAEIESIRKIADELLSINALIVQGKASILDELLALPYLAAANFDAERSSIPLIGDAVADELACGTSTWGLDAVNVADTI
jgi:hypothetical protein